MSSTENLIIVAALTAAVGAVVTVVLQNRPADSSRQVPGGTGVPGNGNSGSYWTNAGSNDALQPTPQMTVYAAPGAQGSRTSYNGQIYTKRFNRGGNPGSPRNYEPSWAWQSATKNPYANGTLCTYAKAVNDATQDPTNQVTSLVLGPGVAPNNPAQ